MGDNDHLAVNDISVAPKKIKKKKEEQQISWQTLYAGEKFDCQLVADKGELTPVIVHIALSGVQMYDVDNVLMKVFEVESILQHSFSRQNKIFSFSYLQDGRFLLVNKLHAPDTFYEMYMYLGNCISMVVKLRGELKESNVKGILDSVRESLESQAAPEKTEETPTPTQPAEVKQEEAQQEDKKKAGPFKSLTLRMKTKRSPRLEGAFDEKTASQFAKEYSVDDLPATIMKVSPSGETLMIKTMLDSRYQVTAGLVEQLIENLADENSPDSLYINDFLLSYRDFLSPENLLSQLSERFFAKEISVIPEEVIKTGAATGAVKLKKLDEETVMVVKLRVASVIKKWVERHFVDFRTAEMNKQLHGLLANMRSLPAFVALADQIQGVAHRNQQDWNEKEKQLKAAQEALKAGAPLAVANQEEAAARFAPLIAKDLAQAITQITMEEFQKVEAEEFVFNLWGKKHSDIEFLTTNLTTFIERFNNLGWWVATEICRNIDPKLRVACLEKMVQIMKRLFQMQNYNDTMAILSGLQSIPIYRLKKTWAQVPSKKSYAEICTKLSPDHNYSSYRQLEFQSKPPLVPFLGLYMKDLTFMNDGNQTKLSNGMINLEKHRTIMAKIMALRVSQQSKYVLDIKDATALPYMRHMEYLGEEDLVVKSCACEPSNRNRANSIASSDWSLGMDSHADMLSLKEADESASIASTRSDASEQT
eukprot:Lithocolla_globosa_v1_NODE_1757_length_2360_cov_9.253796.p1 type:complete len:706 gc:universal NODE_1757_length_2360_cov_9.253796:2264-147(-)